MYIHGYNSFVSRVIQINNAKSSILVAFNYSCGGLLFATLFTSRVTNGNVNFLIRGNNYYYSYNRYHNSLEINVCTSIIFTHFARIIIAVRNALIRYAYLFCSISHCVPHCTRVYVLKYIFTRTQTCPKFLYGAKLFSSKPYCDNLLFR